jgi:hypothetical protein
MQRGIGKQDLAARGNLRTQRVEALSHDRRIDTAFDHVRIQIVVTLQKRSDIQTPTMACGRPCHGGASRLPRVRQRGLSAEASPLKIPESTVPVACTGLQAGDQLLATAVLVRGGRLRRGPLQAFPEVAVLEQTVAGFGPHAFARLLLHRLDDFLDIFGGVVEILVHCVLLFRSADRRTSTPGTIL